jgi:AcrR family transcriptional regulator
VTSEPGLRERKKRRTRDQIAEAAFELFTERGYDAVPVAAVARRAEVSEATVFNYFASKEDLVFHRMGSFQEALLAAVRDRPAGSTVSAAFLDVLLGSMEGLNATAGPAGARIAAVNRVIAGSPALRARERQQHDDTTDALAALLARAGAARSGDIDPWVTANALVGVHRALVGYVRDQILAGHTGPALARRVRTRARRAVTLLDSGLSAAPASHG